MIRKTIEDQELANHLSNLPVDGRQVFMLSDGQIRLTGISGTTTVNQMRENFNLGLLETLVLGQAYIASGLMASSVKGNDRIQLSVECAGPIGGIYTEAWACGAVRGYLKNNPIPLEKPLESLNLDPLYGPGFISVTRLLEGSKAPFTGQTMMQYGDLAKDLALHYQESEQTPTLFNLAIHFDKKGRVTGAGGLFIQAMPGCREETLESLASKCDSLPSLGKAISEGVSVKDYCLSNFADFGIQDLGEQIFGFSCPCSRNQYGAYLSRMGKAEKDDILKTTKWPLEIECFNCGSRYQFSEEETKELFR